jgi:hypothetical protein
MDKPFDKKYENKDWLADQLQTKSPRTISKELHVSYKLINVWAINHGLIKRSEETVVP